MPRKGSSACNLRSRAILALPPALSPSTRKISVPSRLFCEQSTNLPGKRSFFVADLRAVSFSCLRRSRSSARSTRKSNIAPVFASNVPVRFRRPQTTPAVSLRHPALRHSATARSLAVPVQIDASLPETTLVRIAGKTAVFPDCMPAHTHRLSLLHRQQRRQALKRRHRQVRRTRIQQGRGSVGQG